MSNYVKVKISDKTEELYNEIMADISTDIWDVIDNFEYYKKIRGIWSEYLQTQKLTKRQLVRLYSFIYELDDNGQRVFTKADINEMYKNIKTDKQFGVIEDE